jgi:hypothetical protein
MVANSITPAFAYQVIAKQEAMHRAEMKKLDDLAFIFLSAVDGDRDRAESLLDGAIDILFEDGALQLWRYRALLNFVREGL